MREDISEAFVYNYQGKRPIDWRKCFSAPAPLAVEIGCGQGEFLLRTANNNPANNFVGIERDWQRVKKTLAKVDAACRARGINVKDINIRVMQIDVVLALERYFRPKSINQVFCLFPCPWPKKAHVKHRLFSHDFFCLLNSRLVNKGQVQIVTDFEPYVEWIKEEIKGTGFTFGCSLIRPQFDTKFEKKWLAAGHKEFFELTVLKKKHLTVPLKKDIALKKYFIDQFRPEKFEFVNETGEVAVIFKDFLFDDRRAKGMIHLLVAEKTMTQNLWVTVTKSSRGWGVAKTPGQAIVPTPGMARAIHLAAEAVKKTAF